MKIAITGGAGFIGSHLVRAYLDAGHDVFVIDSLVNGSRQAIDPRARFYHLDIRDRKLAHILQMERPDLLSHHAAQHESFLPTEQTLVDADVHIRGLLNVLDSCISASVGKIIFASGGNSLYGRVNIENLPLTEHASLCPQRAYDISKVAGEWYVRYYTSQHGLTHTILRYANVYGERDSELGQHPLSYFVSMLLGDRRPIIRGAADEIRDHIYIDDVVRANLSALERGQNQTLHISSGHGYTLIPSCDLTYNLLPSISAIEAKAKLYLGSQLRIKQFYRTVARFLESEVEPVYISTSLVEASPIIMDNSLAQRVLGWRPEVDFTEGVWRAVNLLRGSKREVAQISSREVQGVLAAVVA